MGPIREERVQIHSAPVCALLLRQGTKQPLDRWPIQLVPPSRLAGPQCCLPN
jgi:hypothetical protein